MVAGKAMSLTIEVPIPDDLIPALKHKAETAGVDVAEYASAVLARHLSSARTLDQVLAVGEGESIQFGTPLVSGASVKATVVSQGRHKKVTIFKMRRRKHYQKHAGHRQNYTELRIDAINA